MKKLSKNKTNLNSVEAYALCACKSAVCSCSCGAVLCNCVPKNEMASIDNEDNINLQFGRNNSASASVAGRSENNNA